MEVGQWMTENEWVSNVQSVSFKLHSCHGSRAGKRRAGRAGSYGKPPTELTGFEDLMKWGMPINPIKREIRYIQKDKEKQRRDNQLQRVNVLSSTDDGGDKNGVARKEY